MSESKVLIVDDEEELAENLMDLLEFEGFEVVMYFNAEDALKNAETDAPDIALFDYQLPGMSGFDLLRHYREKRPDLPIMMVSASSQPNTRKTAAEYGANDFVLKPYDQDQLLAVIREALFST